MKYRVYLPFLGLVFSSHTHSLSFSRRCGLLKTTYYLYWIRVRYEVIYSVLRWCDCEAMCAEPCSMRGRDLWTCPFLSQLPFDNVDRIFAANWRLNGLGSLILAKLDRIDFGPIILAIPSNTVGSPSNNVKENYIFVITIEKRVNPHNIQ